MLSWIPLIGPIIQGIVSIFTKVEDTKLGMRADEVTEAKVSAQIIQTNSTNIGLRIITDMICAPVAIWTMLISWDTIVAKHYPELMWHTANYPPSVSYLPYAVLMFLLGNIGINTWNRR